MQLVFKQYILEYVTTQNQWVFWSYPVELLATISWCNPFSFHAWVEVLNKCRVRPYWICENRVIGLANIALAYLSIHLQISKYCKSMLYCIEKQLLVCSENTEEDGTAARKKHGGVLLICLWYIPEMNGWLRLITTPQTKFYVDRLCVVWICCFKRQSSR